MFPRLRHDAFVGGDHEQGRVDSPDARQHVLDEIAMTRYIHNADLFAVWKSQPPEAEFDRHLAGLLFLETVRVCSCQRGNQRGLSVINMAGCTDNTHKNSSFFLLSSSPAWKKKEERRKKSCLLLKG